VKATTVRLSVVNIGMFIPRTASIVTTYYQKERLEKTRASKKAQKFTIAYHEKQIS